MPLPESVRRQQAEAERLVAENGNTGEPAPKKPDDIPPETPTAIPDTTDKQAVAQNPEFTPVDYQLPEGVPLEEIIKNLRGQLSAMKGKYNAEVPRLIAENKALREQGGDSQEIAQLRVQVKTLNEQLQNTQQPASAAIEGEEATLKAVRDEYGDELVDALKALVANQNKEINQRIDTVSRASIEEKTRQLSELLEPYGLDLYGLNDDPELNDWLAFQGRGTALKDAFAKGDIRGAAHFYIEFSRAKNSSSSPDLSEHVTISPSSTPAPTGEEFIITEEVVSEHYRKSSKVGKAGGYATREEAEQEEIRIFAALNAQQQA